MTAVNGLLNRAFDLLLAPLRPLPLLASLSLVSLTIAIAILLVVRATSDQRALSEVKRQIQADLFEIRLFNDDLRAMSRALLAILRHNAVYFRLSMIPVLWTIVPFSFAAAQLQSYFGYSGIAVNQPVLITAQWRPESVVSAPSDQPSVVLDPASGISVETSLIWFPALKQSVWRVVPRAAGTHLLRFRVGDETYTKTLTVSDGLARRSAMRTAGGLLTQMLNPSEAPLSESAPIESVSVAYPARRFDVFGQQLGWVSVCLVEVFVLGFALKGWFRVSF